jgi:hypothetical protein
MIKLLAMFNWSAKVKLTSALSPEEVMEKLKRTLCDAPDRSMRQRLFTAEPKGTVCGTIDAENFTIARYIPWQSVRPVYVAFIRGSVVSDGRNGSAIAATVMPSPFQVALKILLVACMLDLTIRTMSGCSIVQDYSVLSNVCERLDTNAVIVIFPLLLLFHQVVGYVDISRGRKFLNAILTPESGPRPLLSGI